jgi:hypothetical protein
MPRPHHHRRAMAASSIRGWRESADAVGYREEARQMFWYCATRRASEERSNVGALA